MKRYLEHIKSKEPHEQRRHALAVAGAIVGVFALAWVATLPARLGAISAASQPDPNVDYSLAGQAQTAAVAGAQDASQPGVEVASTSVYSLPGQGLPNY